MEPFLFSHHVTFQTPAWRWETVLANTDSNRFQTSPDIGVCAAKRYWHQWTHCRNAYDHKLLSLRMPNFSGAFSIFQGVPRLARAAIEARILANESRDGMAKKTGISPQVLQTFEDIFFDVRSKLDNPDYIFNQVIGPEFRDPSRTIGLELFWKFFGYVGGVVTLDALMDVGRDSSKKPTNLQEVDRFLADDTSGVLRQKIARAVRSMDGDFPRTAKALVAAMTGNLAKERDERLPTLDKHVDEFIKGIAWLVGDEPATSSGQQRLSTLDDAAAELRDEEVLRVALGKESAVPVQEILAMKMSPSPRQGIKAAPCPDLPEGLKPHNKVAHPGPSRKHGKPKA